MNPPQVLDVILIVAPRKCPKCLQCEALVARLQKRFPGRLNCRQFSTEDAGAASFGVVLPPLLIIDDFVAALGYVPEEGPLVGLVEAKLTAGESDEGSPS